MPSKNNRAMILAEEIVNFSMAASQEEVNVLVQALVWKPHNTEQQRVFWMIYEIIKGMAAKDRFIDGRNEAAHSFCCDVIENLPPGYFPLI